jgi:prevent-host-death family protein
MRALRQRYEVLKETLETEGQVILTHHGKPFARIVPHDEQDADRSEKIRRERAAARARLRASLPFQEVASATLIHANRENR